MFILLCSIQTSKHRVATLKFSSPSTDWAIPQGMIMFQRGKHGVMRFQWNQEKHQYSYRKWLWCVKSSALYSCMSHLCIQLWSIWRTCCLHNCMTQSYMCHIKHINTVFGIAIYERGNFELLSQKRKCLYPCV